MGGFLDLLLSGAGVANQMQGAAAKGGQMRREREIAEAERAQQAAQQAQEQSLMSLLRQSQIDHTNAQTKKLGEPDVVKPTAQQHVVDPVTGEVKFFDPANPPQGLRVNPQPRTPVETPAQRRLAELQMHKDKRDYDAEHPTKQDVGTSLSPAQANTVKTQQTALLNMNKAIAELQSAIRDGGGMAVMPGEHKAKVAALQANAQIQFKEAANLGALSGPDMGLVEGAIGNATSPMQYLKGGAKGALAALLAAQQSLAARARTMETVYGVKMPAPLIMEPPVAAPTIAPSSRGNVNLAKPTTDPLLAKYGITPKGSH